MYRITFMLIFAWICSNVERCLVEITIFGIAMWHMSWANLWVSVFVYDDGIGDEGDWLEVNESS